MGSIDPAYSAQSLNIPWRQRSATNTPFGIGSPTPNMPLASQAGVETGLTGRIALITGSNTGIGRVAAVELARRGVRVFLACRSLARTQPVLDEIRARHPDAAPEWLPLDLSDFESVRACAQAFLARDLPLHLLINNAGLAGASELTASGFEPAFGINHLGHFLLTRLLLERIERSAPARIVTVASRAHGRVRSIDWDAVRRRPSTPLGVKEYCVSKLANVLFSAELGRRLAGSGITTYSLHPGVVASDFWRRLPRPVQAMNRWFMISPEAGARTILHCAGSASADDTGLYYSDCRTRTPSAAARNQHLAQELWRRSEEWTSLPASP
jgi:retinol dehydrogenase 12